MINLLIGASLLALAKSVYYLKKTQLNLRPIFSTKIALTPNLTISVRMSWSTSEVLKPFKKTSCVLSGVKTLGFASSF